MTEHAQRRRALSGLDPGRDKAVNEPEIAERPEASRADFGRPALDVTVRNMLRKTRRLRDEGRLRQCRRQCARFVGVRHSLGEVDAFVRELAKTVAVQKAVAVVKMRVMAINNAYYTKTMAEH